MNELVSVIVPIYKVEKYIRKCLDSILNQSYENLEIILVDDGSPDNCGSICDEYGAKDSRIRVIHKENGGLSSARNAALDICKGDWIICVDSDDYICPDMVEKLVKAAHDYDADLVISSHFEEKGGKLNITDRIMDKPQIMDREAALKKLVEDDDIKNYAWGKLYRASHFEGVRYPEGRNYEDIPTTYRLFDKAKKIVKIPEFLYVYYIRDDSISFTTSKVSWHKGCHESCLGYEERAEYFKNKGYSELYELAMAKLLPYLYSDINSAYGADADEDAAATRKYLADHKDVFLGNRYVSSKDKKLIDVYLTSKNVYKIYEKAKTPLRKTRKVARKLLWKLGKTRKKHDFSLSEGKGARVIFFQLPGFDNLGDHALSFATEKLLQAYVDQNDKYQLFVVEGWDTLSAVKSLKNQIRKEDILVSQGGGNFGSLYEFAEVFRRKIMEAFPDNKIIVMPQTVFYSEDEEGKKQLSLDKTAIERCKDITIFARDHRSFELFEKYFGQNAKILELHDTVALYKPDSFFGERGSDILLCLRSDKESNLSAEDKFEIFGMCRDTGKSLRITDTCTNYDIDSTDREAVLKEKFSLWGSARLVVTDRLHGMIFSIITGSPCIVLGNNHHKVLETYETFRDCSYLRYAEDLSEVSGCIKELLAPNIDVQDAAAYCDSFAKADISKLFDVIKA